MKNWTPEQLTAINHDGDILVSAAAGSGKTAVLTERIVRLVKQGVPISSLLVVTFTNAAAAEMKKRIANALLAEADNEPDAEKKTRLHAESDAASSADISTIHSFCTQVLRRHFDAAGLDPSFAIADDALSKILLQDSISEVLENRASDGGASYKELLFKLSGEKRIFEHLQKLYAFITSQPDPEKWLDSAANAYCTDEQTLENSEILRILTGSVMQRLHGAMEDYRAARNGIAADYKLVAQAADDELSRLSVTKLLKDRAALAEFFDGFVFASPRFPNFTPGEVKANFISARTALRKAVKSAYEAVCTPVSDMCELLSKTKDAAFELASIARELLTVYAEKKADKNVIDYSDMEHMALKLLYMPEIAAEYRRRFAYVFVDEYQDSNAVQEALITRVSSLRHTFFVGDVKQSIYGFRMAEPRLFLDRYARYDLGEGENVDLNANFRSARAVIDAVNCVFEKIMDKSLGGMDYDEHQRLVMGRGDNCAGAVELHVIDREAIEPEDTSDQDDDEDISMEDAEAEAYVAAERIKQIMATEVYTDPDTGEQRPFAYSDFALLHRAPKDVAQLIVQVLSNEGVPAYANITGGYFDAIEVRLFMELLRVTDNRRQDIPLVAVLRSCIGGMDEKELIDMRTCSGGSCFDAMRECAKQNTSAGVKCARMMRLLDAWHDSSMLLPVEELIAHIMDESHYTEFVLALPGGAVRKKNLDALILRARAYAQSGADSLSGFIRFMDRVKSTNSIGSAQIAGANVVRVLSIHKSKGLEFPVSILMGLSKRFNRLDFNADLLFDGQLGIGFRFRSNEKRLTSVIRDAIEVKKRLELTSEEMRLLYVAMTRAKDKLIMIGAVKDTDALEENAELELTPTRCACANCFMDWLYPALSGMHCVHMHTASKKRVSDSALPEREFYSYLDKCAYADSAEYESRFAWRYPHAADTLVPSKISVSELTGNVLSFAPAPDFIKSEHIESATDRGTAMHRLMECIEICAHTESSIRAELLRLTDAGLISKAQSDAVYVPAVARFFKSELGQRLVASERVERELEFNHRVSARKLLNLDTDEPVLLQGVIDCCFIEQGKWILIDYKTDYVPDGVSAHDAAKKHAPQLALYEDALYELTGIPVLEKYIHLLRIGQSVRL